MKYKITAHFSFKGFTLIELLVSLGIMLTMTSILFFRYPETIKRITLSNVTYTVSLLIREAQIRGSAIDSSNGSIGGYGVYASLTNPNKVILFGDVVDGTVSPYQINVGDGIYQNVSPDDETKTITTLPSGFTVSKLCVGTGFPFICNDENTPPITSFTISITRPDPRLNIYINNSKDTVYSAGCIELRSLLAPAMGHVRSVQVFNSGVIRTSNGKCDNSTS
jgi:prepilin-type N-terminal cleavage/methylation domain-containing protein